ncbi:MULTISPECIES: hypothetical protein [Enterobacter]|uniref:hypothetical protein n=1 Tax=Enterobacter TaxID=547 RepID=UPI0007A87558|nr:MULTISPECIES: hypothetical protein [Enterobacter]MCW3889487.1 hypothetical protein [Enterobacter hormaechei subsp. hoffmannii]SAJ17211.1 Uncharacterised protein [Enterobacter hormaechei]SAJ27581.1 Uncharacterised protein [Enterobacter hormaechei]VAK49903.1 Uncharacterised protein [Enterobacter hormaechei]
MRIKYGLSAPAPKLIELAPSGLLQRCQQIGEGAVDIVGGDPPQAVVQNLLAEGEFHIAHRAFGGAALAGAEGIIHRPVQVWRTLLMFIV